MSPLNSLGQGDTNPQMKADFRWNELENSDMLKFTLIRIFEWLSELSQGVQASDYVPCGEPTTSFLASRFLHRKMCQ